jgi:hypothetical protein
MGLGSCPRTGGLCGGQPPSHPDVIKMQKPKNIKEIMQVVGIADMNDEIGDVEYDSMMMMKSDVYNEIQKKKRRVRTLH